MRNVIFLNGEYKHKDKIKKEILDTDTIYCADGGLNTAYELGIVPDYLIGDFDSVDLKIMEEVSEKFKHVNILSYPKDKDYTDFELILKKLEDEKNEIIVFGALGNRTDMSLSNFIFLEKYKNMKFINYTDNYRENIFFVDQNDAPIIIENKQDVFFSIIPFSEKIEKLSLEGFKYEIHEQDIDKLSSRLVSNVINSRKAFIKFKTGKILIIIREKIWKVGI